MTSDVNLSSKPLKPSSTISFSALPSPISPLQPIYRIDSMINSIDESSHGGIFLFETERPLMHTKKYTFILYAVCLFGCWICTIPSVVATIYARKASLNKQLTRAKVMFHIAFTLSFLGLIFFAVQAGYLTWLIRYLMHRFLSE